MKKQKPLKQDIINSLKELIIERDECWDRFNDDPKYPDRIFELDIEAINLVKQLLTFYNYESKP